MTERSIRPNRRIIGTAGEYTVRLALEKEGLRLLGTSWRDGRWGELDIIARDEAGPSRSWAVTMEVHTRVGRRKGSAFASVDHRKVARLRALAGAWCRAHGHFASCVRINVIAITMDTRALESWLIPMDEAVDLRALGIQVVQLGGM